jgi:hypothetical protein
MQLGHQIGTQLRFVCHDAVDTKTFYVYQEPVEEEDFTGERLWFAALTMMCNLFQDSSQEIFNICRAPNETSLINVLELGCGAGVLGNLVGFLARSNPLVSSVVMTDGNPIMARIAEHNTRLNQLNSTCQVATLRFGLPSLTSTRGLFVDGVQKRFDLVVGSDILYTASVVPTLLDTIEAWMSPHGLFLLGLQLHSKRRELLDYFLSSCSSQENGKSVESGNIQSRRRRLYWKCIFATGPIVPSMSEIMGCTESKTNVYANLPGGLEEPNWLQAASSLSVSIY